MENSKVKTKKLRRDDTKIYYDNDKVMFQYTSDRRIYI